MAKIFISYRREDSQHAVDRLCEAIAPYVENPGQDIFIDVDNIPLGIDFAQHLDNKVSECEILLAVIGPRWVGADPETGRRRVDDPDDFVRLEIASALRRGIPVVPVLLDGTNVPRAEDLPPEMQQLSRRNGTTLTRSTFSADVDRMMRGLGIARALAAPTNPDLEPSRAPSPDVSMAVSTASSMATSMVPAQRRSGGAAAAIGAALVIALCVGITFVIDPLGWRSGSGKGMPATLPDQAAPTEAVTDNAKPSPIPISEPIPEPTAFPGAPLEPVPATPPLDAAGPWDAISPADWSDASSTALIAKIGLGASDPALRAAAGAGNANAMTIRALTFWGSTDAASAEDTFSLLTEACALNQMRACANLAILYEIGYGTPKNDGLARDWSSYACKGGIAKAC